MPLPPRATQNSYAVHFRADIKLKQKRLFNERILHELYEMGIPNKKRYITEITIMCPFDFKMQYNAKVINKLSSDSRTNVGPHVYAEGQRNHFDIFCIQYLQMPSIDRHN